MMKLIRNSRIILLSMLGFVAAGAASPAFAGRVDIPISTLAITYSADGSAVDITGTIGTTRKAANGGTLWINKRLSVGSQDFELNAGIPNIDSVSNYWPSDNNDPGAYQWAYLMALTPGATFRIRCDAGGYGPCQLADFQRTLK